MIKVEKINRTDLSELVFRQIMKQIENGTLKPGSKIPSENKLSELFGVSRVSIRAALHKLQALGVVYSRQGEGTYVSEVNLNTYLDKLLPLLMLSRDNVKNLLEFREIIEVRSAALAALRRTDSNLKEMENIIDRMRRDSEDLEKFSAHDLDFHLEIARATQNIVILKANELMKSVYSKYMEKIVSIRGNTEGLKYHPRIYGAIKKKDEQEAARLMKEHIYKATREIEEKQGFNKL